MSNFTRLSPQEEEHQREVGRLAGLARESYRDLHLTTLCREGTRLRFRKGPTSAAT